MIPHADVMDKDPTVLLQMLFQVHAQVTLHNPLCMHEFSAVGISSSIDLKNPKILEAAMLLYKTLPCSKSYGSVDIGAQFWFTVFCDALKSPTFKVPNGCCTNGHCPIKHFYECIHKTLLDMSAPQTA